MIEERDLSYYTYKKANELGMMLYFKKDIAIIKQYITRLLEIPNLFDIEKEFWELAIKAINITGEYNISTIRDIFRDNRFLTDEEINKLNDDNIVNDLDETMDSYISLYKRKTAVDCVVNWIENFRLGRQCNNQEVIEAIEKVGTIDFNIDDVLSSLKNNYEESTDAGTISCCVPKISQLDADFRKGTINTVFAYSGHYKTLYCTNVAYNAIKNAVNTCYISLEISSANMYYNFLSRYSNESIFERKISHSKMKNHRLDEEEKKYLFDVLVPQFKNEMDKHLIILDESNLIITDFTDFDNALRKVDDEFISRTGKGVDLVIIDHVNLLKFDDNSNRNDYSKVNYWLAYFRKNCINFVHRKKHVCFLAAAQSNRNGYQNARKNGGVYTLDSIAESNETERASSIVLALYADEELKNSELATIQLLKNRDNATMEEPLNIGVKPKYYFLDCAETYDENELDNDIGEVVQL